MQTVCVAARKKLQSPVYSAAPPKNVHELFVRLHCYVLGSKLRQHAGKLFSIIIINPGKKDVSIFDRDDLRSRLIAPLFYAST